MQRHSTNSNGGVLTAAAADSLHGLESLEDFKRKLDSEHATITTRLTQGAAHRRGMETIRDKLAEDLKLSQAALAKKMEKIIAKHSATSRMLKKKEEQMELLEHSLEDAIGQLDASKRAHVRHDEFLNKLEFESEEIARKLRAENDKTAALHSDMSQLTAHMQQNEAKYMEQVSKTKGTIDAEEQIVKGFQDFADMLTRELEQLKRKFVIETKFKSKQEAYRERLQGEMDTVRDKIKQETTALDEMGDRKATLEAMLTETTARVEADLGMIRVQLDTESKLVNKMSTYTASLSEQLEFVKGSLVASNDVNVHLQNYLEKLSVQRSEAEKSLAQSTSDLRELEILKTSLEQERAQVSRMMESEVEDGKCQIAHSEAVASLLRDYLQRITNELETISDRLEDNPFDRLELEELRTLLESERASVKQRLDSQMSQTIALAAHNTHMMEESASKIASLDVDMESVEERIRAEKKACADFRQALGVISGEETVLKEKARVNNDNAHKLEVTRRRLMEVSREAQNQLEQIQASCKTLADERYKFGEDLTSIKRKIESEMEELSFRIGIQKKAVAGLKGFEVKLSADLEFVDKRLTAIAHVRNDLEEQMRRFAEVLEGVTIKMDSERTQIRRLHDDLANLEDDRKLQRGDEQADADRLKGQIEAEDKMKAGVEEYQRTLGNEMRDVQRMMATENKRQVAILKHQDALKQEMEILTEEIQVASSTLGQLEDSKRNAQLEMDDVKLRFGGDLDDVTDRLEVDQRAAAGLEGYRRNLGAELDNVSKKLSSTHRSWESR